jgi:NAD+ kinase
MSDIPQRIGTVVLNGTPEVAAVVAKFAAEAAEVGIATCDALEAGDSAQPDVIVGIGGDGTLLRAAHLAHDLAVPVVGINLGTVGYLTEVEPELIRTMLDRLVAGELDTNRRMTLAATLPDGKVVHAINDIVMEKVISQRLVQISVAVNEEFFTTFRADGLLVATPLGSTAYSLSAGGPVVDPDLDALIMTPVAPHSLMSRTTIFTPDTRLTFTVATGREVRVNFDGRTAGVLRRGESVLVSAGARPVRFLSVGTYPFPQAVRHQFGLDHA